MRENWTKGDNASRTESKKLNNFSNFKSVVSKLVFR